MISVQKPGLGGVVTFAAAAATDTFPNDGNTVLIVKNDSAADITVTIDSARPCNYGFDHDVSVTVPAGGERVIGPFPRNRFNDNNSQVAVSFSDTLSVTVAAVSLEA